MYPENQYLAEMSRRPDVVTLRVRVPDEGTQAISPVTIHVPWDKVVGVSVSRFKPGILLGDGRFIEAAYGEEAALDLRNQLVKHLERGA
jgi:hypothetical protein